MRFIFFCLQLPYPTESKSFGIDGYTLELWKPSLSRVIPPGQDLFPYLAWWMMHHLMVFRNKEYSVLIIRRGERVVHRSLVTPGYFRFPFMAGNDLQIGDTWTAPEHRGKGLATLAIRAILNSLGGSKRVLWYLAPSDNLSSIRVVEKTGFERAGEGYRSSRFGMETLGSFTMTKQPCGNSWSQMKRLFDLVLSTLGLIACMPILLWIASLIAREDRGPIFYRGIRVGLHKKSFRIFKFRTMVIDAEKIGGPTTSADDPRVTSVGKWLRKYKLDELPQLFNVLRGEMSFVGPRPEVKSEVEHYGPEWDVIFTVRPGITDLSSIEFRNEGEIIAGSGIEDPHEAYKKLVQPRKLELQEYYAKNSSMALDLRIIFQTLFVLARGK